MGVKEISPRIEGWICIGNEKESEGCTLMGVKASEKV